jgi:hypothetical protein
MELPATYVIQVGVALAALAGGVLLYMHAAHRSWGWVACIVGIIIANVGLFFLEIEVRAMMVETIKLQHELRQQMERGAGLQHTGG